MEIGHQSEDSADNAEAAESQSHNEHLDSEGQTNEDIFEPRIEQTKDAEVDSCEENYDIDLNAKKMCDDHEMPVMAKEESPRGKKEPITRTELASVGTPDWTSSPTLEVNALTPPERTDGEKRVTIDEEVKIKDSEGLKTPDSSSVISIEYCCCAPDNRPSYNTSRIRILGIFQIICALVMFVLASSIVFTEKMYHYTGLVGPFAVFLLSGAFALVAAAVEKLCVRNFSLFLACFSLPLSVGCMVVAGSDLQQAVLDDTNYFANASVSFDVILTQHVLFAIASAVNTLFDLLLICYASLGVQMDCFPEDEGEDEFESDMRQAQRESVRQLQDEERLRRRRELWRQHARESKMV